MELPVAVIALVWAVVAYIIYSVINTILTSRRHAALARELKCEEPPYQKNAWPGGIDQIRRAMAADKAKLFPVDQMKRYTDLKTNTFKYSILGSTNYSTCDEKNIQAMLATQFADWGQCPQMELGVSF